MNANPITPDEAREALELIEDTTRQMRRLTAHGGIPFYLVLWGMIWILGFGATHFLGPNSHAVGTVWAVLSLLGLVASFGYGAWLGRRVHYSRGERVGLFWLAWLFYGGLLVYFAHPRSGEQMSLMISLLAMMGYVISGLLYESRFLVVLGLVVTGLIVAGYLLAPDSFNLWMAVLGGGSLVAAGLYIHRAWR